MGLESVRNEFQTLSTTIGRAAVSSLFPNDFEYYVCSLELINSLGETIDNLVFPVMPDSISDNRAPVNRVRKSFGGVVSLYNSGFIPFGININGTFGRKFRILTSKGFNFSGAAQRFGIEQPEGHGTPVFNSTVKTGYGAMKILERIYLQSFNTDVKGKPYKLIYNNLAFNDQFMVEFNSFTPSQSMDKNRMWQYDIQLQAIAPAFEVTAKDPDKSNASLIGLSRLNETMDNLMNSYKNERRNRRSQLK